MSITVPFVPTSTGPFTFPAVFDQASYNVSVQWCWGGQRYLASVFDGAGNLIYCLPVVGSPDEYAINLNAGYFDTPMSFSVSQNAFVVG